MTTPLERLNERKEKRIATLRTLLEHGETGESIRARAFASIKRRRWLPSEKAASMADAQRCIDEAVRRHYGKPSAS